MAFDASDFKLEYILDGEDDISIRTWNMETPFAVRQYGPYGGSFRAEVIQRRNSRREPWFFVPKVTLMHMETTRTSQYDDGIYTEPTATLPKQRSFDDAIFIIRQYVLAKVNAKRWVGKTFDDEWWLPTEAEAAKARKQGVVWI